MRVNKTLYVLCALFLGGIGIHKFYADKVGQGVLHLVFLDTYSNNYFDHSWHYHYLYY